MGVSNTAIRVEGGRARMGDISRREFLKRSAASGLTGGVILSGLEGLAVASTGEPVGSVIDLTRCDGCADREVPPVFPPAERRTGAGSPSLKRTLGITGRGTNTKTGRKNED